MEGYEVITMEGSAPRADIFVTCTGDVDVITMPMEGPYKPDMYRY